MLGRWDAVNRSAGIRLFVREGSALVKAEDLWRSSGDEAERQGEVG